MLAQVTLAETVKLKVRATAGITGELKGELESGAQVTIVEGPVEADNLTWWKVDNGAGLVGWSAEGAGGDIYLKPAGEAQALPTATATTEQPAPTATVKPTPTATATAEPTGLKVGMLAQVTLAETLKLKVRATAGLNGELKGELENGAQVTIVEGPVEADNLTWWKVDNGAGLVGWSAGGAGEDVYLVPAGEAPALPTATATAEQPAPTATTEPEPTATATAEPTGLEVGKLAQVTLAETLKLKVRATAGLGGDVLSELENGAQVTIVEGPVEADNLTWWKVDNGAGLVGWSVEGEDEYTYLVPVEGGQ